MQKTRPITVSLSYAVCYIFTSTLGSTDRESKTEQMCCNGSKFTLVPCITLPPVKAAPYCRSQRGSACVQAAPAGKTKHR